MRYATRSTTRRAGAAVALLLVAALAIAGCSSLVPSSPTTSSGESAARSSAGGTPKLPAPAPSTSAEADTASQGSASTPAPKLVIVNKTLRLEADDVNAALTRIRELAKRDGGDISNLQVATSSDQPIYRDPVPTEQGGASSSQQSGPLRAYVTVRVPATRYQAFVDDAAKLGRVLFQSESAQDVTQQHVDLEARLGNLKAEQQRLRQMFAKARNITEMLQVERELSRVQGEIEAMQGQIDYLERQAAMATVTIELAEPKPLVRPTGTDWGVATAVTSSIRMFVGTFNGLIVILGPLLALLLFLVLPVFLIVRLAMRIMRRRPAPKPVDVTEQPAAQTPEETA
jgi:hypothetical protein